MTGSASVSWVSGGVHLDVLLGVTLMGLAYAWAWARHRGRPSGPRFACFYGALLSLVVTLNGPLHDLADAYLFSAHMVQHLVLTLLFPPLLLLGTPTWMADALLAPLARRRAGRWLVRRLTRPVPALGLYSATLVLWHLPAAYDMALREHGWHIVQHLTLMASAVLAWWPVLSPSTVAPPVPYGAQILYLFAFGMPMTVVAAMVTGAETLLYTAYAEAPRVIDLTPFADQRLGGVIMWVPAGLIPLLAFTAVFFRWAAAEADDMAPDPAVATPPGGLCYHDRS
jgi:putative membrane protein